MPVDNYGDIIFLDYNGQETHAEDFFYDPATKQLSIRGGVAVGNLNPDQHPTNPNVADDEFEEDNGIDFTGTRMTGATPWAWMNQDNAEAFVNDGCLNFQMNAPTADGFHGLYQPQAGSTWTYRAKMSLNIDPATNNSSVGLFLWDTVAGGVNAFLLLIAAGDLFLDCALFTSPTNFAATQYNALVNFGAACVMEISRNADNVVWSYSKNGADNSFTVITTVPLSGTFGPNPTRIGLGVGGDAGSQNGASIDWFRRLA